VWQQVMETVLRMTNLFKEFILKIMSSEFKTFNLAVGKSSRTYCMVGLLDAKIMRRARF